MKKMGDIDFDLRQIRSFLEVLNEKSFTRASRKLKVGQATISHHIGQLEKMLGVRLIDRTARGVSVTEAGRLLHAFGEKMMREVGDLAAELAGDAKPGSMNVAASTIPAAYILPPILSRIRSSFPSVRFRLETADSRATAEMVREGRVEAGVVGGEYRHPSLEYTRVCEDDIVLVGPADGPERIAITDIAGMNMIIREAGSGTRRAWEEALSGRGVAPSSLNVVMECSSTLGIMESIGAGMGVSFVSGFAARRCEGTRIISVEGLAIRRSFYFVSAGSRRLSRAARELLNLLVEFGESRLSGGEGNR